MSSRPALARRDRLTLALAGAGFAVSAVALFVAAGPLGVAVAAVAVGVALGTTGVLGVATLHLGTIALVSTPTVVGLVFLETASFFLLVADAPPGRRLETGAFFVPIAVGLAVAVSTVGQQNGLVTGAVALVTAVALGTYLLHRYAQVRLGIAEGTPASDPDPAPDT